MTDFTQESFSTIQDLASFLCACMETTQGTDGKEQTGTKSECPAWARDLIYSSRADNADIWTALAHISDSCEGDDIDDVVEGIEPDAYTADLLNWLAADITRYADIDEVVEEIGWPENGLLGAIGYAQVRQQEELCREMYELLEEAGRVKPSREAFEDNLREDVKEMGYDTEEELYAITDDFLDALWEEKGHDRTGAADEAYNAIIEDQEAKAAQTSS